MVGFFSIFFCPCREIYNQNLRGSAGDLLFHKHLAEGLYPARLNRLLQGKEKQKTHPPSLELDEDIKKVLLMTDSLLAELPEEVLNEFVQSEAFELYEKVLNKYKIK
jgi:hypothetical protein